jgi:hypothetical protein
MSACEILYCLSVRLVFEPVPHGLPVAKAKSKAA